jgi:hypothetical protein
MPRQRRRIQLQKRLRRPQRRNLAPNQYQRKNRQNKFHDLDSPILIKSATNTKQFPGNSIALPNLVGLKMLLFIFIELEKMGKIT